LHPTPSLRPLSVHRTGNLIEQLDAFASDRPEARSYTFLADGETESGYLTYAELARRTHLVAAGLRARTTPGAPALLVFPPGLEFVVAFLGCLRAGVIAVPLAPPRANRPGSILPRVLADTHAQLVLTSEAWLSRLLDRTLPAGATWLTVETLIGETAAPTAPRPLPSADAVAVIQYTSGSTSAPKGVMITHRNLAHNQDAIREAMGHAEGLVGVGWLPHFHDMGLVGNLLQPLYLGGHFVFMPPSAFVQNPSCWLRAISRYRATSSGGPNFAFDLCVEKISDEQKRSLDLSAWEVCFAGAEPVHAATLERFSRAFAACGFRPEAWLPCYGMAETTLIVTGHRPPRRPQIVTVDATALRNNRWVVTSDPLSNDVRTVVSCGAPVGAARVVIQSLATAHPAGPGEIGEILVAGDSVSTGYWKNPELTAERFGVTLPDCNDTFLRTGDIGVLHEGELMVLGRIKEILIVRGQNFHPEDLEHTAQAAHAGSQPGGTAVFGATEGATEQVIVLQEVQRGRLAGLNGEVVAREIQRAIASEHGLQVHAVLLLKPGRLARTTSGKIQRAACRDAFIKQTLEPLYTMSSAIAPTTEVANPEHLTHAALLATPPNARTPLVVACLKGIIVRITSCDPLHLDSNQDLRSLGLDSMQLLELKLKIDELAGVELDVDSFLDTPTLAALAGRAVALLETAAAPIPAPAATTVAPAPSGCPFHAAAKPAAAAPAAGVAPATAPATAAPVASAPLRLAPGPDPREVQADYATMSRDFLGYLLDLTRRYGEIVRFSLGDQLFHLVTHPDDLSSIFITDRSTWIRGGVWAPFNNVMGGHGLITSEGEAWKEERNFARTDFTPAAVAAERAALTALVQRTLAGWSAPSAPLDLLPAAKRLTLEMIVHKLFGPTSATEIDALYAAAADIDSFWNVPAHFILANRGEAAAAAHRDGLRARVEQMNPLVYGWLDRLFADPAAAPGVMGHYVRSASNTPEDRLRLRDVAVTYLLTGFDTTASGIYWTVEQLLENPRALEALQVELAAAPADDAQLADAPLLNATVHEALRLYPPVWYLGREATQDTTLRGMHVPAGSFALACPYVVHRNPWTWSDPAAFKPERFLPSASTPPPAKAYLPFGLGTRVCIGKHLALAEIALTVGVLFRHYSVKRAGEESRVLASDFTLRPRQPIQVCLAVR
jgi:acyl-CoA synthetase (AMP-forming)/AMP-acid ligase II/cytochrome P450/acyl carrier protein